MTRSIIRRCFLLICFVAFVTVSKAAFASWQIKRPTELFVQPGQKAVVELEYIDNGAPASAPVADFEIVDTDGNPVSSGTIQNGRAEFTLPQGFFELVVTTGAAEDGQKQVERFGIASLPPFCTHDAQTLQKRDPFFCIDAAMSWLVNKDGNRREELVKIARRSGIVMIRDRLSWTEIQNDPNIPVKPDGYRGYNSYRKLCKANDVEVLEMFHDAPAWTGKRARYPENFNAMADLWSALYPEWSSTWGGLEVWNEPDISFGGDVPADQYAPILKTMSWTLSKLGMDKPVLGSCVAVYNQEWLDTAQANDVHSYCDVFSYHTYARAEAMRSIYARFAEKINGDSQRPVPMWITECGRPWKRGKDRADSREDKVSAGDIVMKAVVAKSVGVERYFPFVYPYYDERDSNFGMMDKSCSPMRSFVGYAQMIRVLSGFRYIGDVPVDGLSENKALAFVTDNSDEAVLVLYTGTVDSAQRVALPCPALRAERITGEPVSLSADKANTVPVHDGLIYVWASRSAVEKLAVVDPALAQIPKAPSAKDVMEKTPRKVSPIVVRYVYDESQVEPSSRWYQVKSTFASHVTIKLALENLSDAPIEATVYPPKVEDSSITNQTEQQVVCPARGRADVEWDVDLFDVLSEKPLAVSCRVAWENPEGNSNWEKEQTVVMLFHGEPSWAAFLKKYPNRQKLEIGSASNWSRSQSVNAKTILVDNEESTGAVTWKLRTDFPDGDHWTYPSRPLPSTLDLTKFRGVLIRYRCQPGQNTVARMFLYENKEGGRGSYISKSFGSADGRWHSVFLPFDEFQHCTACGTDANNQLDLNSVGNISFGGNTKSDFFELEVSEAYWVE